MNTWTVWDATKAGMIIAGLLVLSSAVMADDTDVIADHTGVTRAADLAQNQPDF